jgi:hypothetical protein
MCLDQCLTLCQALSPAVKTTLFNACQKNALAIEHNILFIFNFMTFHFTAKQSEVQIIWIPVIVLRCGLHGCSGPNLCLSGSTSKHLAIMHPLARRYLELGTRAASTFIDKVLLKTFIRNYSRWRLGCRSRQHGSITHKSCWDAGATLGRNKAPRRIKALTPWTPRL